MSDATSDTKCAIPTWEGEIKDYFTQLDIGCMRQAGSRFDLADYETVKRKWKMIYDVVEDGFMPKGGRKWSEGKVARFKLWGDNGCPRG